MTRYCAYMLHLRMPCGEKQFVSSVCRARMASCSGHEARLFLPDYAGARASDLSSRRHFHAKRKGVPAFISSALRLPSRHSAPLIEQKPLGALLLVRLRLRCSVVQKTLGAFPFRSTLSALERTVATVSFVLYHGPINSTVARLKKGVWMILKSFSLVHLFPLNIADPFAASPINHISNHRSFTSECLSVSDHFGGLWHPSAVWCKLVASCDLYAPHSLSPGTKLRINMFSSLQTE